VVKKVEVKSIPFVFLIFPLNTFSVKEFDGKIKKVSYNHAGSIIRC